MHECHQARPAVSDLRGYCMDAPLVLTRHAPSRSRFRGSQKPCLTYPHHHVAAALELIGHVLNRDLRPPPLHRADDGRNVGRPDGAKREERKDPDFICYAAHFGDRLRVKFRSKLVGVQE